ncbi:unnamed protein product [Rotaria sordida]|uniref:BEN domain-containing protein n=1 Tax=Rotaria sordida TaxID=392033 RepID=A0A815HIJ2_9BILA|nr:unnamed protein product [Rotaria sordida]
MERYDSKISLADSPTSSCITKTNHTHVIIQTNSGNKGVIKYIVLPVKNLVNFGRPLKTNDLVTYKVDLKCRGTNRGKIVLFGSEDDCTQQVHILSSVGDENDVEISGMDETINTSEIQVHEQTLHDRVCNNKVLKKVIVGTSSSCKSSITFETSTNSPSIIDSNTCTPKNNRTTPGSSTLGSSTPLQTPATNSNNKRKLSPELGDEFSGNDEDDEEQNDTCQMDIDALEGDEEYFLNKYNKLKLEHRTLEKKYNKLLLAYRRLKKNSLPMPGDDGRNWLIQVGRQLEPKSSGLTTDSIAEKLGIKKTSLLTSCIRNSASNTTRQIIKLLYSPAKRQKRRGKDVPMEKRKLIKAFVVQEHGTIDKRSFCEAINGVFRSYAHSMKKKKGVEGTKASNLMKDQQGDSSIQDDINEEDSRSSEYDEEPSNDEDDDL